MTLNSTGSSFGSIVFRESEWQKIREYTRLCPDEIGCMGYAKLDGNHVLVDEVFLVPQEVSLSKVDFLTKGLPYAVEKAAREGRLNDLRFCWHSHATHGAFFSSTDEDMVDKVRKSAPIPWFASAVLNKKGETWGQIDYFRPEGPLGEFCNQITLRLDVGVEGMQLDQEKLRLDEIDEFVQKVKYTSSKSWSKSNTKKDEKKDEKKPERLDTQAGLQDIPHDTPTAWKKPTKRDWKLHKKAQRECWEAYVADDIAYYWDADTLQFEGSAPIPLTKDGKEYAIDVFVSVADASEATTEDGKAPAKPQSRELVLVSEMDDSLLEKMYERGQV